MNVTDEMVDAAAKVAWEYLSPHDGRVPWERADAWNQEAEKTKARAMLEAAASARIVPGSYDAASIVLDAQDKRQRSFAEAAPAERFERHGHRNL